MSRNVYYVNSMKTVTLVYSLVFLGGGPLWDEDGGEFPPLSPPDEPLSSLDVDGPAVTLKSQFSFDMRNSS